MIGESEDIVTYCLKRKVLRADMVYSRKYIKLFVETIKKEKITGPFIRGSYLKRSEVLKRFKELEIEMKYNRKMDRYFIANKEFYDDPPEKMLFDPDLLYLEQIDE